MKLIVISCLLWFVSAADAFLQLTHENRRIMMLPRLQSSGSEEELLAEAENLLRRARDLRATLPVEEVRSSRKESLSGSTPSNSKWRVKDNPAVPGVGYRLAMDIGREDGTWMDPRWGASGRRISLSLDVLFSDVVAEKELQKKMIKDNFGGQSSSIYSLQTAPVARLRNGFDEMKCSPGAYRVDSGGNGKQTARFFVPVSGTPEQLSPYG
jgi:hypothetical protein